VWVGASGGLRVGWGVGGVAWLAGVQFRHEIERAFPGRVLKGFVGEADALIAHQVRG
jgi:hypothetical protein